MNTELTQAAYDEAAHDRLAEIRKITGCKPGEEAGAVRAVFYELLRHRKALHDIRASLAEAVKVL